MRRRKGAAAILLALCLLISSPVRAALPSLFTGDEAWYRDPLEPLVIRDGVYYVPADLFGALDGVTFTMPAEGNLLFENTATGAYVSILFSKNGSAATGGEIVEGIGIYRDETTFYVEADPVCDALGIRREIMTSEDGSVTMRLLSGDSRFTIEQLAEVYEADAGWQRGGPELLPVTPEREDTRRRLYLLCTSPEEDASYVASLGLARAGLNYTVFLWDDADPATILGGAVHGEYGVATDDSEDLTGSLAAANERIAAYTHRRTVLTISTGDPAQDAALGEAGFCPITPDLTVTSFTDPDEAMNEIAVWLEEEESVRPYAVVFFTDCWMSDQMIPRVAELIAAAADWTSANLGY